MVKHEIVCILRAGCNFLHTEGAHFAAKVTDLQYEPGKIYNPEVGVKQEWFVPRLGWWG